MALRLPGTLMSVSAQRLSSSKTRIKMALRLPGTLMSVSAQRLSSSKTRIKIHTFELREPVAQLSETKFQ